MGTYQSSKSHNVNQLTHVNISAKGSFVMKIYRNQLHHQIYVLAAVLSVGFMSACSSKSVYEFGQGTQKNECIKQAKTAWQLEECDKIKKVPFEEYQRQKEQIKKHNQSNLTI